MTYYVFSTVVFKVFKFDFWSYISENVVFWFFLEPIYCVHVNII
jgi:hypothetical protein